MADNRFAISIKDGIQNLKEKASNDNTRKSTQTWINMWRSWAEERGINLNLEENSAEVLDSILQQFYAEGRVLRTRKSKSHDGQPRPLLTRAKLSALYNKRPSVPIVEESS